MSKIADAVVVIGKTRDGSKIYRTVGALFSAEDSSKGPGYFLRLDKSFNPAGALSPAIDDPSITVSFYFPSGRSGSRKEDSLPTAPVVSARDIDDDLPF